MDDGEYCAIEIIVDVSNSPPAAEGDTRMLDEVAARSRDAAEM